MSRLLDTLIVNNIAPCIAGGLVSNTTRLSKLRQGRKRNNKFGWFNKIYILYISPTEKALLLVFDHRIVM